MSYFWDPQGRLSGDYDGKDGAAAEQSLPPVPDDLKCGNARGTWLPVVGLQVSHLDKLQGQEDGRGVDQHQGLWQRLPGRRRPAGQHALQRPGPPDSEQLLPQRRHPGPPAQQPLWAGGSEPPSAVACAPAALSDLSAPHSERLSFASATRHCTR